MGSGPSTPPESNNPIAVLTEHAASINCMAVSSNNTFLITGSDDETANIWSTRTSRVESIGVLKGHTGYITCCAIVDTDVITGSADGTIRKWCLTRCQCSHVYKGHQSQVNRIICTGEFIFSSSYDTTAKAWFFNIDQSYDRASAIVKDCIKTFTGHTKSILPIIYIPANGVPSEAYNGSVNINPDDLIITGSADCTARAWAFDSGVTVRIFEGHTNPITSMVADSNGKTLFTSSADSSIRSWSITKGITLREFKGHEGSVICVQLNHLLIYSGSADKTVRCWVADLGDCTQVFKGHQHTVTCFRIHNRILFTGCGDSLVRAFNIKTGDLVRVFKGHVAAITAIVVVDSRLFTSSTDGQLFVWDISQIEDNILTGTSVQLQIGKTPLHNTTIQITP